MKIGLETNSGLYRIWTRDLCNTGADYSSFHGFIWNQRNDQLQVGLGRALHSSLLRRSLSFSRIYLLIVSSGSETDVLTVYWLKGNLAHGECVKNIFLILCQRNNNSCKVSKYRQPDLSDSKRVYPSCS